MLADTINKSLTCFRLKINTLKQVKIYYLQEVVKCIKEYVI